MADSQELPPPQSPPLAALVTNRSDLALLDESDDLLSPSILGSVAARRVRSALSPAKACRRSFGRQQIQLETLREEEGEQQETGGGRAADEPPAASPLPALPQPQQIASPPSSPDAPAVAVALRTQPRSPLLSATQASIAAGHHVDTEVLLPIPAPFVSLCHGHVRPSPS